MTKTYTLADLRAALAAVALRSGSTVMMHSSLFHLGRLAGHAYEDYAAVIVAAVREHLGPEGTLAAPAAFYDFGAQRTPFDTRGSPVSRLLGVLSRHVAEHPDAERSINPIFSVAATGAAARHVCGSNWGAAFGPESPWQRMYDLDGDILLLGCEFSDNTFTRFVEHRVGVPYLYNKLFTVAVSRDGERVETDVTAPLRYRHCQVEYDPARFQAFASHLRADGLVREAPLGGGVVKAIGMHAFFDAAARRLSEDVHYFLKRPLPYQPDAVPLA